MLNRCAFIGRLGKDPEVKTLTNGDAVANFSIACSEKWKDKTSGEWKEKTEWVNIVAWSPLADKVIAKYFHKGDKVYLEGKMQTRSWDKEGVTRYTTEIVVSNLVMLNDKPAGQQGEYQGDRIQKEYNERGKEPEYKASSGSNVTDDLPF